MLTLCSIISLVPRPPPFFVLRFAFSIIHGSGRARKTGKAWSHLSRAWRQVDARWTYGGEGHNRKYGWAPPPLHPLRVHLTSHMWWMRPGLPRFSRSSTSVYYTERKPKNKKRGRPGNEATFVCHQNVAEPQATENDIKYTHVYTGTRNQAWLYNTRIKNIKNSQDVCNKM